MGRSISRPIRVLIGLLLFSILLTLQTVPPAAATDSRSRSSRSPPLPYGAGVPVGQYNGTGDAAALLATYNKTVGTKTKANDTDDFSILVPSDWEATVNISFTDVRALRVLLDIETNDTVPDVSDDLACAMSFHVTNSCRLRSLMMKFQAHEGDLVVGDDIRIRVYNATEDNGKPKPGLAISSAEYVDLGWIPPLGPPMNTWVNVTWAATVVLNTSRTYSNYFFVVAFPEPGALPGWSFRSDASTGDKGYAWRSGPSWIEHLGVDYFLNISLWPLSLYPAPTQISMKVNGTAVANATANAGWWNRTFTVSGSSAFFNVSATWPIVFNYTYGAWFRRLFVADTSFVADDQLSEVAWNITCSVSFPTIGANSNSRTLNFTIPSYWDVLFLYRGSTLIPPTNYTWSGSSASESYLFIDEPHGAGSGTWRVVCTDRNYVDQVLIHRNAINVSGSEVNITDTLQVNASLQTFYSDGIGQLTLYDENETSLATWPKTPVAYWLNFSQFSPVVYSDENGKLTCEVIWSDGRHVGVGASYVWVVYTTNALPEQAVLEAYVDDLVTLRVFYNDTFNNQPITGASVNVTIDGATHNMADSGAGWYQYVWDSTGETNINYPAAFVAKKTGYAQAVASATVSLQFRTQISWSAPPSVEGGDAFNVSTTYEILGGGGIDGASFMCLLNNSPFTGFVRYELGTGQYRLRFILNVSQTPATYNITLTASHAGYASATFQTLVQVTIRPTDHQVIVTSASPLVYSNQFVLRVNFTDGGGSGISGALVTGNWTGIAQTDYANGTYTILCPTASATAGYWSINFSISLENYEIQWFVRSFELVWPTTLTPTTGTYTLREYVNETLVLQVTYTDAHNGTGITTGTLWAVFRGSSYGLTSLGGGVYSLSLGLTGVPAAPYTLSIFAQGEHYQERTLQLTLEVLAKLPVNLTVTLPPVLFEGTQIPVTIQLAFVNATPIAGAKVTVTVWVHHANGTDVTLISQNVTTDGLGQAIHVVLLPSYPPEVWSNGQPPEVWVLASYGGSRTTTTASTQASRAVSQSAPISPLLVLLLRLLPFIIVMVVGVLVGWAYYAKAVKPGRAKRLKAVESGGDVWAQRMLGLLDLRALFVMHASSGLPIFTYSFTGGELPSTLLSGFISAVSAFHGELSGQSDRASQVRDIHYKDLHLSLNEGKQIISVAILEASPSEEVTQSLADFTKRFEQTYATDLGHFEGRIDVFEGADELVGKSFHSDLLIAYKCDKKPSHGFPQRVYALAKNLARPDGHVYLPQLFVAAVEKFGADKKYAIGHAIETLRSDGCLAPSTPQAGSARSPRSEDPPAQG